MIEGLLKDADPSPVKPLSENIKRDASNFLGADHNFSIPLVTKRKLDFNLAQALLPPAKPASIEIEAPPAQ